jgi:two-component system cell cycle sensor histidine kinase/response regulator CckA
VDDEQAVRSVLRRYLNRRGWGVVEAADAEQALALIAGGTVAIDAVIVDLHMPGLGGASLCQRIATTQPALSARMILASGDAEAASEALKEQKLICPVLAKPFELTELERALGNMLAH